MKWKSAECGETAGHCLQWWKELVPVRTGRRPIQSFLLVCKGFALEKISKNKDCKEMGKRSRSEEQEKLQNERKRFSNKIYKMGSLFRSPKHVENKLKKPQCKTGKIPWLTKTGNGHTQKKYSAKLKEHTECQCIIVCLTLTVYWGPETGRRMWSEEINSDVRNDLRVQGSHEAPPISSSVGSMLALIVSLNLRLN